MTQIEKHEAAPLEKSVARAGSWLLTIVCVFMLGGCVTHTDSSLRSKANAGRAEAAYVQLGLAYIAEKQLAEARDNLRRALEINASSAPATAAMGLVFQMQSEEALAEEHFRKALNYDSGYTRGRTYYGAFLYAQKRFEEAYDQFERATNDTGFEDRGQVFYNLALCASRLGRDEKAIEAYQKAVNIQGESFELLSELSRLLVYTGQYEQAARYFERLDSLVASSPAIRHTPRSLLTGLRLARHGGDGNREASLALLLRNLYPESSENKQYKALTADD